MSSAFIIAGRQGSGKSTSVKSILKKLEGYRMFIFDLNKEYTEFNNSFKGFDDELFLKQAEKLRNSVIVFEEATVFMTKGSKSKSIRRMLVGKRHTNNIIIFIFHNIRSISSEILSLTDFIVLHKTMDNPEYVRRVFEGSPKNFQAYNEIKNSSDRFYKKLIKNSNN